MCKRLIFQCAYQFRVTHWAQQSSALEHSPFFHSTLPPCFKEAIICIREDIIKGLSLHRALSKQMIFQVTLQQMVDVGEESGSLPAILEKASQIYERDIGLVLDTIIPLIACYDYIGVDGRQFIGGYVFTSFSAWTSILILLMLLQLIKG